MNRWRSLVPAWLDGARQALAALAAHRLRAALTVLGILVGVAAVVTMGAVISGIRSAVVGELAALGPNNFVVARFDQTKLRFGDGPPWRGKPPLDPREATELARLPSIARVLLFVPADAVAGGRRGEVSAQVQGYSAGWMSYQAGRLSAGRDFLPSEERRAAPVTVLSSELARRLDEDRPLAAWPGQRVRFDGAAFEVVGVFEPAPNPFTGRGSPFAVVPWRAAVKYLDAETPWMQFLVVPRTGIRADEAIDDVVAALRTLRGLRPNEPDNFAIIPQRAFLALFDRLTGVVFLVMLTLSSLGLFVGGVGVTAIMTIAVTERTREIGLRKALGATRGIILWQFLLEAVVVTAVGGLLGLAVGLAGAGLVRWLSPVAVAVPWWSVAAALATIVLTGVGFGLWPALRAARLDPVVALRHE